ncbi:MAG TPA: arginase [Candidatus Xenobia bacterium]|nr:arginase [Candidatus Xenobia bacterium]
MPTRKVRIIGVPMDLGQDRRGVDMGPSALRVAGLNARIRALGYAVEDLGNIAVRVPEEMQVGAKRAKYLPEIAATCAELAKVVSRALDEGSLPLLLGGDHSLAIGSLAGVSAHYRKRKQKVGLVWLDAHADMNTPETSPSGNVHGMPFAATLGFGPKELTDIAGFGRKIAPENASLVGARNLDPAEKRIVRESGLRVFTMREIDERGMRAVMEEALARATAGTAGFAVSLDMDFVEPHDAPGVGTPVRGGVTYREAHLAMEMIADSGKMVSMEVVEINPVIDSHNKTAQLGVELVLSALGKKIL